MNVQIVVLNCQKCNQCLKGHKSLGLFFEGVLKLSLSLSFSLSMSLSFSYSILISSCLLIIMIKCLKGHRHKFLHCQVRVSFETCDP